MNRLLNKGIAVAFVSVALSGLWPITVNAALNEAEVAQLGVEGTPLTPMGAIRAGNEEGTIPIWEGGITKYPEGYVEGGPYVDPYPDDKILFSITSKNYKQYLDQLSEAHIGLFETYPGTYRMDIYPTRRSASYPQFVYASTLRTARTAHLCDPTPPNENCVAGMSEPGDVEGGGIPFPIPKSGMEALWSGNSVFLGKTVYWPRVAGHLVAANGSFTVIEEETHWAFPFWMKKDEAPTDPYFMRNGGVWWAVFTEVVVPPKDQGQILSLLTFMGTGDALSYIYVPGQRRVRKAPNLAKYDAPAYLSDGMRTGDGRNGIFISGDPQWFDWKLLGKREQFVAYNSYKLTSPKLRDDGWKDLIQPGHINRDLVRYELHRVWELEGKLREGYRHIHPRIKVYMDEDSWARTSVARWDASGRQVVSYDAYLINFYNSPSTWGWGDTHHDLINRRYGNMNAWPNTQTPVIFNGKFDFERLTPQGLRRAGRR